MDKQYGFGSVSSGTLRTFDLIDAFATELEWLTSGGRNDRTTKQSQLIADADEWLEQNESAECDEANTGPDHFCRGDDLVAELADALKEFAPPYFYFGSHPGDGADFGFWLPEYFEQDFDGLRVNDTSEVPADYAGEVLHVNDHGNMTLYAKDEGSSELREIWSLV